ncbi:GntR family transcriptional regulator [Paraglaciecola aquimarina]|uniref:GntR family transcriptional regulator n=1 Tax=Paraglaciecola aquimarina TaxID=1235557 RepID=A0ABU3ST32_9ALTE|nr:GntR family transcriptional regulator [Paraglaciecola aquimarina]MDU0353173.1 GntR family transcriptional regulator [Paraglaciecola aquimarina]
MNMKLGEVKRSPLIEDDNSVYSFILNDIANAVFVSGDRLVTTALAKKYDTSITPVREALKQLQGEGLVTIAHNSGSRVASFEYESMRDTLEVLHLLEPFLIEYFVEEHTEQEISALEQLMVQMETADNLSFKLLDTDFHWSMYKNHYNRKAVNLWRKNRLQMLAAHSSVQLKRARIQQSIQEHREIMSVLKKRDVKGTLLAMQQHLTSSDEYWSRYLGR